MPVRPSAAVRRRRSFAGLVAILVLCTVAFTFLRPQSDPAPARGERRANGALDAAAVAAGDEHRLALPPAYLAWMSGGFPPGFRDHVRTLPGVKASVVFAGDTRWLTASTDADGRVVDRPPPPYAIPIDAFAVDPAEYAPFLPDDVRDTVIGALERGEGVLGERSARLREIGPGGTLEFDGVTVSVGAVVPDEVVGWSELVVSRDVGADLGIVDERYLLAFLQGSPGVPRVTALLGGLLPEDTPLRVVPPGGSTYMRVGSGVNPPVVMKDVFGEFAAHPDPGDPAALAIDPGWSAEQLETRSVPLLGRITCNGSLFPALIGALREIEGAGLSDLIDTYNGCYAARTVARSPTAPPSQHAYGAAVDINASANAYGAEPRMDPRIVAIFERWGFIWGGDFLIPDGMHFEFGTLPDAA